jgi:hypothetical protein
MYLGMPQVCGCAVAAGSERHKMLELGLAINFLGIPRFADGFTALF